MTKQKGSKLTDFLARFIVESDAIELITDSPALVRKQLREELTEGHVGALLFLESLAQQKEIILFESAVRQVQCLITAEQHTKLGGPLLPQEWIGKYRQINVRVGGRLAPSPASVPTLMFEWIKRVNNWQQNCSQPDAANLLQIARLHFEYEHIHPFADGNGRSGRALVYYFMRYCGLSPFVFTSADRFETYYRCFQDPEAMSQYFKNCWQDAAKTYKPQ